MLTLQQEDKENTRSKMNILKAVAQRAHHEEQMDTSDQNGGMHPSLGIFFISQAAE